MHEKVHQRASQQQKEKTITEDVRAMLGKQEKAADRQ
jgi:hypothetical protein